MMPRTPEEIESIIEKINPRKEYHICDYDYHYFLIEFIRKKDANNLRLKKGYWSLLHTSIGSPSSEFEIQYCPFCGQRLQKGDIKL